MSCHLKNIVATVMICGELLRCASAIAQGVSQDGEYMIYEGPIVSGGPSARYHIYAKPNDYRGEIRQYFTGPDGAPSYYSYPLSGSYAQKAAISYWQKHYWETSDAGRESWGRALKHYGYEIPAKAEAASPGYRYLYVKPPAGTNVFGRNYGIKNTEEETEVARKALNYLFLQFDLKSDRGKPRTTYDKSTGLFRVDVSDLDAKQLEVLLKDNPYYCVPKGGQRVDGNYTEQHPLEFGFLFDRGNAKYYDLLQLKNLNDAEKRFGFNAQLAKDGQRKDNPTSRRILLQGSKVAHSSYRAIEIQPQLIDYSAKHPSYTKDYFKHHQEKDAPDLFNDFYRKIKREDIRQAVLTSDFKLFLGSGRSRADTNVPEKPIDYQPLGGMAFVQLPNGLAIPLVWDEANGNFASQVPALTAKFKKELWRHGEGSISQADSKVMLYHAGAGFGSQIPGNGGAVTVLDCRTCHDQGSFYAGNPRAFSSAIDVPKALVDLSRGGSPTDKKDVKLGASDLSRALLIYSYGPQQLQDKLAIMDYTHLKAIRDADALVQNPSAPTGTDTPLPLWSDITTAWDQLPVTYYDLSKAMGLSEQEIRLAMKAASSRRAEKSTAAQELETTLSISPKGFFDRTNLETNSGGGISNFCKAKQLISVVAAEERNKPNVEKTLNEVDKEIAATRKGSSPYDNEIKPSGTHAGEMAKAGEGASKNESESSKKTPNAALAKAKEAVNRLWQDPAFGKPLQSEVLRPQVKEGGPKTVGCMGCHKLDEAGQSEGPVFSFNYADGEQWMAKVLSEDEEVRKKARRALGRTIDRLLLAPDDPLIMPDLKGEALLAFDGPNGSRRRKFIEFLEELKKTADNLEKGAFAPSPMESPTKNEPEVHSTSRR